MMAKLGPSLRHAAAVTCHSLLPSNALGLAYSWVVRWRLRRCGSGLRLRISTTILGPSNISIGERFVSLGLLYLYAVDNGELVIGDDCRANTNVQFGAASGRLVIGSNVIVGPNVVIRVANHGTSRDRLIRAQPPVRGEIIIEDDVWIGSNAVITSGVTVAKGTVVAAGAVVTHSTEPYSVVGGVPAKKIGERL